MARRGRVKANQALIRLYIVCRVIQGHAAFLVRLHRWRRDGNRMLEELMIPVQEAEVKAT